MSEISPRDALEQNVPDAAPRVSAMHLALVIIGGTIGFSVFIVSAQIGGALGYGGAFAAFLAGGTILGILGAATSYVGARTRFSTYELTQHAFGRKGAHFANLAVALSLIGWYAVISNFIGQAGQSMILDGFGLEVQIWLPVLVVSALIVGVTLSGFQGLERLALLLVPLMLSFLVYAAFVSFQERLPSTGTSLSSDFSFTTAISAVVGSYISGVVIQPDYSRFARSTRDAVVSVYFALGVCFPLIQFLSAMPSLNMQNPDLLVVMSLLGLSIPAFLLLFTGGWSSNVLCLYSAWLSVTTVMGSKQTPSIILVIGIVGTAIAFVPAQSYLVDFLVALGIFIPPIAAIYCLDFLFFWSSQRKAASADTHTDDVDEAVPVLDDTIAHYKVGALCSWFAGSGYGWFVYLGGVSLTSVAALDTIIVASAAFLLLRRVLPG